MGTLELQLESEPITQQQPSPVLFFETMLRVSTIGGVEDSDRTGSVHCHWRDLRRGGGVDGADWLPRAWASPLSHAR
jgi:hypothetical protein